MGLDPVEAPNLFLGSSAIALTAITTASIKSSFKDFIQKPTQDFFFIYEVTRITKCVCLD